MIYPTSPRVEEVTRSDRTFSLGEKVNGRVCENEKGKFIWKFYLYFPKKENLINLDENVDPMDNFDNYKENYGYESWQDKPNLIKYSTQPPSGTDVKLDPIIRSESGTFMNGGFPSLHISIHPINSCNRCKS